MSEPLRVTVYRTPPQGAEAPWWQRLFPGMTLTREQENYYLLFFILAAVIGVYIATRKK